MDPNPLSSDLILSPPRVQEFLRTWAVEPERVCESGTSWLVFGQRRDQRVVLKVLRAPGDEWLAGSVIAAFGGQGMVRVLEYADGAMLLEQIRPAVPLVDLTAAGRDDEAGAIFTEVLATMAPGPAPKQVPTVADWGRSFQRHIDTADTQIPPDLFSQAQEVYDSLVATQKAPRLLHGDLHHENILLDAERGWLAVDPKGVIGELEFEIGAWLRNPPGCPELYTRSSAIDRRLERLSARLPIDPARTLGWAFAQGVLSAIWTVEDEGTIRSDHPGLALAGTLRDRL